MSLTYAHLIPAVRAEMATELAYDLSHGRFTLSTRLTREGREEWVGLLRRAVALQDDVWLAEQLRERGWMGRSEPRRVGDDLVWARIPSDAADLLATDAFNRLYIRGVCRWALAHGLQAVEVVRGRRVRRSRPVSAQRLGQQWVGQRRDALTLLDDVRLGEGRSAFPPGPGSSLTVWVPGGWPLAHPAQAHVAASPAQAHVAARPAQAHVAA